jgi:hypothetical protein
MGASAGLPTGMRTWSLVRKEVSEAKIRGGCVAGGKSADGSGWDAGARAGMCLGSRGTADARVGESEAAGN